MLYLIIALTVLISIKGFKDLSFFNKYKFNISSVKNGEKYRMFSSAFLHVDFNHLFFNLFTLFVFSNQILNELGGLYYIIIYTVSLYFGNYYTYKQYKNNGFYSAVGASGAVSGIVYSAILLFPEMKLVFIFFPIPLPSYIFGIGYILYSIYGMKKLNDNIGHSAHLGGAISGIIITILIKPSILISQTWLIFLLILPFIIERFIKK
jgi:membrane associated rhomboid family serine protease